MKFALVVALMPFASGCILVHALSVERQDVVSVVHEEILRKGTEADSGERRVFGTIVGRELRCRREARFAREDLVRRTMREESRWECRADTGGAILAVLFWVEFLTIVPAVIDFSLLQWTGHGWSFFGPPGCTYSSAAHRDSVREPEKVVAERWAASAGPVVLEIDGVGAWEVDSDRHGRCGFRLGPEHAVNAYRGRETVMKLYADRERRGVPSIRVLSAVEMVRIVGY